MFSITRLLDSLHVEQLDNYLFRGDTIKLPLPQVYGGQVLAQALNAASRTVVEDRLPHSLHGYFLRRGDQDKAIIYEVDPIRDGGSFSTRRVIAKQNGKAIFNCSISFQRTENGFEHQMAMPDNIVMPEELAAQSLAGDIITQQFESLIPKAVIDMRPIKSWSDSTAAQEPVRGTWLKFGQQFAESAVLHRVLLTYISDWGLMETALYPHAIKVTDKRMQLASLDHAMWFHSDFRIDDWIYYHIDSPRAAHARGFNRGSFYSREGILIASCAQEGLMRINKER